MHRLSLPALAASLVALAGVALMAQRQSRIEARLDALDPAAAAVRAPEPARLETPSASAAEVRELRAEIERLRSTCATVPAAAPPANADPASKAAVVEALRQMEVERLDGEKQRLVEAGKGRIQEFLEGLAKSFSFTAQQRDRIAAVLAEGSGREAEAISNRVGNSVPWGELVRIRKDAEAKVKELLTPAQFDEFAEYSQSHFWGAMGGSHYGGPPPAPSGKSGKEPDGGKTARDTGLEPDSRASR